MWMEADRGIDFRLGRRLASAAMSVVVGTAALVVPAMVTTSLAGASNGIDTSSHSAFIKSVAPLAQDAQARYGVPASVAIAQAIQESGWGESSLTTDGNAYFGIKCNSESSWADGCVQMRTHEEENGQDVYITDGFRTYDTPRKSFMDHGEFLRVNDRYAAAFNYTKDPDQFIREVHRAGYATESDYSAAIIGLMDEYNLRAYDNAKTSATAKPTTPAKAKPSTPAMGKPSAPATRTPAPSTRTPSAKPKPTKSAAPTHKPATQRAAAPAKSPSSPLTRAYAKG